MSWVISCGRGDRSSSRRSSSTGSAGGARVSVAGAGGAISVVNNFDRSRLSFPGSTTTLALRFGRGGNLVRFFRRKLSHGISVVLVEYNLSGLLNELMHDRLLSVHVHVHVRRSASSRAAGLGTIVGNLVTVLVQQPRIDGLVHGLSLATLNGRSVLLRRRRHIQHHGITRLIAELIDVRKFQERCLLIKTLLQNQGIALGKSKSSVQFRKRSARLSIGIRRMRLVAGKVDVFVREIDASAAPVCTVVGSSLVGVSWSIVDLLGSGVLGWSVRLLWALSVDIHVGRFLNRML